MKFKLSEFIVEIIIFLIGLIISIVSFVQSNDVNTSLSITIFVITLSTDIIIISIKYYIRSIIDGTIAQIEKTITSFFNCCFEYMLHNDTIDERWKSLAIQTLDNFKNRMQGLYEGKLPLKYDELFFYQNELIKKTQKSLCAIHIANNVESLILWDPQRPEESRFKRATYYACRDLDRAVKKKRLFIIDKQLENTNIELINRVVQSQIDDLHFEVKKIYTEDINSKYKMPHDVIISDDKEVIKIIMQFNKVESAYSYINQDIVNEEVVEFQRLWDIADGFEDISGAKRRKKSLKKEKKHLNIISKFKAKAKGRRKV